MQDPTLKQDVTIRPARPDDADALLAVHVASIRGVCASHYTAAQIEAWAAPKRAEDYKTAMASGTLLVAEDGGTIVGFGDCGHQGVVRGLYLHPDRLGAGIGRRLLDALEAAARQRGITEMQLHSSLNAIPFYERAGYVRRGAKDFELPGGSSLECHLMTKMLS